MADKDDDIQKDHRLRFMFSYIARSLKIQPEKWQRIVQGEEKNLLIKFFDGEQCPLITFRLNQSGVLIPSLGWPKKMSNKVIYFLRNVEKITMANYRKAMTVGEISDNTIAELANLVDHVVRPLLCNPANHEGWPQIIVEDVTKHVTDFKNLLLQVRGEMTNEVMLPLPAHFDVLHQSEIEHEFSDGERVDLYLKSSIETSVIKWANQIKDVLKEDSTIVYRSIAFSLPMDDVMFYKARLRNLEGIYTQLRDLQVTKIANYLEHTNSVYTDSFKIILTNVVTAIVEVRDIVLYQKPLIPHFENFANTDFRESTILIRPMLHCIGLLWGNSKYYCSSEKIIPLLSGVCNLIIQKSSETLEPTAIFRGDPDEQLLKLSKVKNILHHFKSTYDNNRKNIASFFPSHVVPVHWMFHNNLVFERFNKYMKRLNMIEEILLTCVELTKIERVEIGGLKGKDLSLQVSILFDEFTKSYQRLSLNTYDPADPEDKSFLRDYREFRQKAKSIDRKLAMIFCIGFDDCSSLEGMFKFLHIMGDIAQRPLIKIDISPKYKRFIELIVSELDQVNEIFIEGKQAYQTSNNISMIDAYLPPTAGMIWWTHKLKQRIKNPLKEFNSLDDPIVNSEAALVMNSKYEATLKLMDDFEKDLFETWCKSVDCICDIYLKRTILIKELNTVKLNFHSKLSSLIRELRYLKFLSIGNVPRKGIALLDQYEKIQLDITRLIRAITWYNCIKLDSHATEVKLIQSEITEVDNMLEKGLLDLNWKSDVQEWVTALYDKLNDLQLRVLSAQENIRQVLKNIATWGDQPLFSRKANPAGDKLMLLDMGSMQERWNARENNIRKSYSECLRAININIQLYSNISEVTVESTTGTSSSEFSLSLTEGNIKYQVKEKIMDEENILKPQTVRYSPNAFMKTYVEYIKYIDLLISQSITKAMHTSLDYFLLQMDRLNGPKTAFKSVAIELVEPDLVFSPCLESDDKESIYSLFKSMINAIYNQGKVFPRISGDVGKLTYEDASTGDSLPMKEQDIHERVRGAISDVLIFTRKFDHYAFLWINDRKEVLVNFLEFGQGLTNEEIDNIFEAGEELEEQKPTLEAFQKEIDKYEEMYRECDAMEAGHLFHGWLYLDLCHLKQAFLNLLCKWSNSYKQHLVQEVRQTLEDWNSFIDMSCKILDIELTEDDFDELLKVMNNLAQIKERSDTYHMLSHVRDVIDLLRVYGVTLEDEVFKQNGVERLLETVLEILPDKWKQLLKQTITMKNNVLPLIQHHTSVISKKVGITNQKIEQYYLQFKKLPIFSVGCINVYNQLDEINLKLALFEEEIEKLSHSCNLFSIAMPERKLIIGCRTELKLIKQLWDHYFLINWTIDSWKKTLWRKIDVEAMDAECKKFSKDLRSLDKELRNTAPYIEIEGVIKNLMTSLKAIVELQNPSIKDRHWTELMKATKVCETITNACCDNNQAASTIHNAQSSTQLTSSNHITSTSDIISPNSRPMLSSPITIISSSDDEDAVITRPPSVSLPYFCLNDFRRTKCVTSDCDGKSSAVKKLKCSYSLKDFEVEGLDINRSFYTIGEAKISWQKNGDYPVLFCENIL